MTAISAQVFATDWIEAFNAHDLERILSHYAKDVQLVSPLYRLFTNGETDTACGTDDLRAYFRTALQRYPDLHFTLLEIAEGSRGLCIRYRSNLGDRIAVECFERAPNGSVTRALCHYVEP